MMLKKANLIIFLVIFLLTAVACGGGEEAPAAPTAAPEVAAAPTDTTAPPTETAEPPTAVPTDPPVEEHPTEEHPTEEPTAVPAADPAPERSGLLRFRDSDTAPAGSIQLLMEGIAAAPAGTHYELWLVDNSLNTLNLGEFAVADSNATYDSATEQNLLSTYSGAFISIEADGVDDGEIGTIAFNDTIPEGSLVHIRHVVTAFPANPDSKAFLIGAQEQLQLAADHAGLLLDELANGNLREAQRHAEHVVNILDGETGSVYGDLDGDSLAQNPGDGFGVRSYLEGAKEHTNLATDVEDVTAEIQLHAGHVLISSDNALGRLDAAIAEALHVVASDSAAEAQPAAEELLSLLEAAMNGLDANGDGSIAPIPDEGGVLTAYIHALNMGSFEFFAADAGVTAVTPAEETDPADTAAETPTAVATDAAPPPVAESVTVEMVNFAFVPNEITVSAGTNVTWVNKDGGPRHSATASDNSFDTGLFNNGEQASITFDKPGTYIYYCLLHGSPDGSGMAATIIVTDK